MSVALHSEAEPPSPGSRLTPRLDLSLPGEAVSFSEAVAREARSALPVRRRLGKLRPMTLVPAPGLEHAFDASILVEAPVEVGETGAGLRRVIAIAGGVVTGPRLSGRVLPGGADYQMIRPGGLTELHARYVVETDGGDLVYVENSGIRFGPADALERIRLGLPVDPALIYFRSAPRFEAPSPGLAWLSQSVFVASGARRPDRVELSVFRVT